MQSVARKKKKRKKRNKVVEKKKIFAPLLFISLFHFSVSFVLSGQHAGSEVCVFQGY